MEATSRQVRPRARTWTRRTARVFAAGVAALTLTATGSFVALATNGGPEDDVFSGGQSLQQSGAAPETTALKLGSPLHDKTETDQVRGSVSWGVVDPDENPLAGTTWQIVTSDGQPVFDDEIEDCIADTAEECSEFYDSDHRAGWLSVAGLEIGDYELKQEQAPEGYKPAEDGFKFSVTEGEPDFEFEDPVVNELDEEEDTEPVGIAPMSVPSGETGARYLWEVRDTENNLVGGATFSLQGPRAFLFGWGTSRTVSDCVSGTCGGTSIDRDNAAGIFAAVSGWGGFPTINNSASPRYRLQPTSPPPGYAWVSSTNWVEQAGTNNTGTWTGNNQNRTYDFGTFQVEKVNYSLSCAPGVVYGISGGGQLQEITTGKVKNLGSTVSGQSNMNGLGIGPDGEPVYAIARSGSSGTNLSATVYQYNTSNGTWTSVSNSSGDTSSNLVGGAVNLKTGIYYFGGFTSNGNFRVYQFNPSAGMANRITFKGTVVTGLNSSSNGDMAFDDEGNLYIVHGSGTTSTVYSVTAANFEAAAGTDMTSSQTASFTTMSDVNGITFDSDGKIYLGSSGTVRSYNMPGFTDQQTVVSSGLSSTDLAGCGSPPTIVIEKEVVGGRAKTGDQFRMTLNQGNTELGTATTTGNSIGVQAERIGPVPTVRNVALTFAEFGANGANLNDYASAYQCTVTHKNGTIENLEQVNGTSGSITIPSTGDAVRCVFRNSPLAAQVTIIKHVTDATGANPTPAKDWDVKANITATTGTVSNISPTNNVAQKTGDDGSASWTFRFGAATGEAKIGVSEMMQDGYAFDSLSCVTTHIDNSQTVAPNPTGPGEFDVTGVKPGDDVVCTYVNKPVPGSFSIDKAFDESVPDGSGMETEFNGDYTCVLGTPGVEVAKGTWTRAGTGEATLTPTLPAGGTAGTTQTVPQGAVCSVIETQPTGSDGLPNSSWEWDAYSVEGPVTIAANQTAKVTVTNKAKRIYGNFSVTKVVPDGSTVDDEATFYGGWSCALGEETVTGTWGPIAAGATWTSTDEDKIPLGATCSVTSEERPDSPVADDPSYEWDGEPVFSDAVEASDTGTPAVVTVTNKTRQALGSVAWQKVAKDTGKTPLAGSEWSLAGPTGSGSSTLEISEEACTGAEPAGGGWYCSYEQVGKFKVYNLTWGEYTLSETKPPVGYKPVADQTFTIGAGDNLNIDLGQIENEMVDGPDLPLTGGQAAATFGLLGGGLLAGALALAGVRRRGAAAHATH